MVFHLLTLFLFLFFFPWRGDGSQVPIVVPLNKVALLTFSSASRHSQLPFLLCHCLPLGPSFPGIYKTQIKPQLFFFSFYFFSSLFFFFLYTHEFMNKVSL